MKPHNEKLPALYL